MRICHPLLGLAALAIAVAMSVALVLAAGQFASIATPALLNAGIWLKAHRLLMALSIAAAILPSFGIMLWIVLRDQRRQPRPAEDDPRSVRRLPLTFGRH